jgi:uncharacterized membrane protein AbrB (regulator of aidB expression)
MSLKHTITTSVRSDAGAGISDQAIITGDAEVNVGDVALAGTVREIDVAVDVSLIASFYIESDQPVTVNTNIQATPAQTFDLVAKVGLLWNTARHDTNPLTVDITKLFFDNTSGLVDANVKCGFLVNVGS